MHNLIALASLAGKSSISKLFLSLELGNGASFKTNLLNCVLKGAGEVIEDFFFWI